MDLDGGTVQGFQVDGMALPVLEAEVPDTWGLRIMTVNTLAPCTWALPALCL